MTTPNQPHGADLLAALASGAPIAPAAPDPRVEAFCANVPEAQREATRGYLLGLSSEQLDATLAAFQGQAAPAPEPAVAAPVHPQSVEAVVGAQPAPEPIPAQGGAAPAPVTSNEPAPEPPRRTRGRPKKASGVKLLEACASGGLAPALAGEYLDMLAELEGSTGK